MIVAGLVVVGIGLLVSGFFACSETAFVVANRLRVEMLSIGGGFSGRMAQRLLHDPASFLTTTRTGNRVVQIVVAATTALLIAPGFRAWLSGQVGAGVAHYTALPVLMLACGLLLLLAGEILPRAIMHPTGTRAVTLLAVPLRLSYYLLFPIIWLTHQTALLVARLLGADPGSITRFMRLDFEVLLEENRQAGRLDLDENNSALLANVLTLDTIRVRESMVPRTDIEAVEEHTPLDRVRDRFVESGYSKLAVYRDNIDNIVGIAFAADLFARPQSLAEITRPAHFVPESKKSKDLLREFLATGTSIAIVIDEYGGTAGLVTREDLLEELFGDIQDEFDDEDDILRPAGAHSYVVSGRVDLETLCDRTGIALPRGEYETVAGYLLDRIGAIPAPRDAVEADGLQFNILKATPRRIDLVRITRKPSEDA